MIKKETRLIPAEKKPAAEATEQTGTGTPSWWRGADASVPPPHPTMDPAALLKQHPQDDRIEGIRLRAALNDILYGSPSAQRGAFTALVALGPVAEPFAVAALDGAAPKATESILKYLLELRSGKLHHCIAYVLQSEDLKQRLVALQAAQQLDDVEARPFLTRGLHDPQPVVRRRVLSYLSWRNSSWALAEIRELCHDADSTVKWAALEALITLRPAEAQENLELMMPSLGAAHRRRAVTLIERHRSYSKLGPTVRPPAPPSVEEVKEVSRVKEKAGVEEADEIQAAGPPEEVPEPGEIKEKRETIEPGKTHEPREAVQDAPKSEPRDEEIDKMVNAVQKEALRLEREKARQRADSGGSAKALPTVTLPPKDTEKTASPPVPEEAPGMFDSKDGGSELAGKVVKNPEIKKDPGDGSGLRLMERILRF